MTAPDNGIGNHWGCWKPSGEPLKHPHEPRILDVACGYDARLIDQRCAGCHRQREQSPVEQLHALNGLGDAAA